MYINIYTYIYILIYTYIYIYIEAYIHIYKTIYIKRVFATLVFHGMGDFVIHAIL